MNSCSNSWNNNNRKSNRMKWNYHNLISKYITVVDRSSRLTTPPINNRVIVMPMIK